MILKIVFLIMICIPIGCIQSYLLIEAIKDLKKPKKPTARTNETTSTHKHTRKHHLRIAK